MVPLLMIEPLAVPVPSSTSPVLSLTWTVLPAVIVTGAPDCVPSRWLLPDTVSIRLLPTVVNEPPLRIVRFSEPYLSAGVKTHKIEGVDVPVYEVAKTIADLFRHRKSVGVSVALEGLREALRQAGYEIGSCHG